MWSNEECVVEAIYYAFFLNMDVAEGCMNGALSETQINSWKFASVA